MITEKGTYRLNCDVVNPRPDGRVRHDWRSAKVWKEGMLFVVHSWVQDSSALFIYSGKYSHQWMSLNDEDDSYFIKELIDNLDIIVEKPSEYVRRIHSEHVYDDILNELYYKNCFSWEQLISACDTAFKEETTENKG